MTGFSRRSFVIGSAAAVTAAVLGGCGSESTVADRVIYGNIYTANEESKYAEAVAIKDGVFVYVGDKDGVSKFIGEGTVEETYDSAQLITPALVDGHTHVNRLMASQMDDLGHISQGAKAKQCVSEIKDYVAQYPDKDFYILTGWEMQNFTSEEYGCPTAAMLDGITDKPILALASDGHSYWVNNALMELAGITKDTVCADGGEIVCDKDGMPLGVFKDTAEYLIDAVRPERSMEVYEAGAGAADTLCLKEGYVYRFNATDNQMNDAWKYPDITAFEELDQEGKLQTYVQGSFVINNTDDALDLVDEAIKLREQTAGSNYEVTNVKIFLDGIIENAGAYLSEEYANNPGYYGTQRWQGDGVLEKMGQIIAKSNKAGMTVHFHAMGDQATSDILTAMEYAVEEVGLDCVRENRNAIAHLGLVKESDYSRFADMNVVAVFNPWCVKDPGYYSLQVELLGKERADKQYPMASFLKAGVHCAFGTDLGASFTYNSVECFHALTTRIYKNNDPETLLMESEKLTREETLYTMTMGGAYEMRKEGVFGSVEVGKEASLCVFSQDLLTIPDEDIMSTEVLNCMYKGVWTQ